MIQIFKFINSSIRRYYNEQEVWGRIVVLICQFVNGESLYTVLISMCCGKIQIDLQFAYCYEIIKYVREWYVLGNASIRHFVTLFLLYINFKNLSIRQFVITMLGREIRVGLVVFIKFVNLSIRHSSNVQTAMVRER